MLTRGVALPIAPVAPNVHDAAVAHIPPMEPEAEMGLPNPQHVMKPPVTAPSQSQTKKHNRMVKPHREVGMESANRRSAPCIPTYDSSRAQTRAC